ncbi:SocA family protein [Candidatus Saccharibacteria bacterium]|nr:SocA family protein [Candidatus Saccharibacteria bacterium]
METFNASEKTIKVAQALGFLLSKDENKKMNRVKLIKLLWAADRLHLRRYGRTVTDTSYFAMVHGPVSSLALDIARLDSEFGLSDGDAHYIEEYFTSNYKDTSMSKNPGDDYLSETEKAALSDAWEMFKDADPFDLADQVSHEYPEWNRYKDYFEAGNSNRQQIDLADFFKNPAHDPYFQEDETRLRAAEEIFNENKKLNSLLCGA